MDVKVLTQSVTLLLILSVFSLPAFVQSISLFVILFVFVVI